MNIFDVEVKPSKSAKEEVRSKVAVYDQTMDWVRFSLIECPKTAATFLWRMFR